MQGEVLVIEGYDEVLLLVERVLELDGLWLSRLDPDGTLWLRCNRFTIKHASILNTLGRCELKNATGVANSEWLVFDSSLELHTLIVLSSRCRDLSHFSLEVALLTGLVHTLDFDCIVGGLL